MEAQLRDFLARVEAEVIPADRLVCEAAWDSALTGSAEAERRATDAEVALRRIFMSRERMAELRRFRESGEAPDPLLARQLDLLHLEFLGNQADEERLAEIVRREKSIETVFSNYRAAVRGRRYTSNEVTEVLKHSRDPEERREIWEASKGIGAELAPRVLELVELRNRVARDLGFQNHYHLALELQELSEKEVFSIAGQFRKASDGPFRKMRGRIDSALAARYGISTAEIRPWHMEDPFFQEAPALHKISLDKLFEDKSLERITRDYYRGIGLPVDDCLARSDLHEREGKNQHAFCIDMDRSGDVRVLCNIRPTCRWMETMLHEYGHAIYDIYNDPELPFILRTPAHTFTTEAIANMMGRQARESAWLQESLGVGTEEFGAVEEASAAESRAQMLVCTRWMLVVMHFERALYENPRQDLNRLWWDLVEEMQFLRRPNGRDAPDWASKIHIACYPVYYHNYLLGELLASQLRAVIDSDVLGGAGKAMTGNRAVGEFLRAKVFGPGARMRWDRLVEEATGSPIKPDAFVGEFLGA